MQVELHTDVGVLESLREEWEELLPRSFGDRLFQHPAWSAAWWRVFGPEGGLRLLTVRDAGRLVGVAPLFLAQVAADASQAVPTLSVERPDPQAPAETHTALMLVGGTEVSDYLDLIVERAQAPAVYEALFHAFRQEIDGWEWIDLHSLPGGSPTPSMLGDLARAGGLVVSLTPDEVCPVIALPTSWEGYLATLGKKERHELRRKMNRLGESGQVELKSVRDLGGLDEALAAFMALHEASTPDKADFMRDPRMRRFFRYVAQAALEGGWLDLRFLAVDGNLAATMFCFRYGNAELVYNSGFDPRAWPSLSPGIVLLGHMIREAIEEGLDEFDFMQGNERYKYDLGGRDRTLCRLLIRRA